MQRMRNDCEEFVQNCCINIGRIPWLYMDGAGICPGVRCRQRIIQNEYPTGIFGRRRDMWRTVDDGDGCYISILLLQIVLSILAWCLTRSNPGSQKSFRLLEKSGKTYVLVRV